MAKFLYERAGKVILRHRLAKGWSQEKLAIMTASRTAQIEKYEADKAGVPEHKLTTIAAALGVAPVQFFCECLMEAKPDLRTTEYGKNLMELSGLPRDYYETRNHNGNGKHREPAAKAPHRLAAKANGAKRNGSRANGHKTAASPARLSKAKVDA